MKFKRLLDNIINIFISHAGSMIKKNKKLMKKNWSNMAKFAQNMSPICQSI